MYKKFSYSAGGLKKQSALKMQRVGEPTFKAFLTNVFILVSLPKIIVIIPLHKKIMWLERIMFY